MPMTTMKINPVRQPTHNKEINYLLAEVRRSTGEDWIVDEYEFSRSSGCWWWRKYEDYHLYQVQVRTDGCEYQIINLEPDQETGYCTNVPSRVVTAFLYGVLAGCDARKRHDDVHRDGATGKDCKGSCARAPDQDHD